MYAGLQLDIMIITHDLVPDLACPWKSLGNKDLSQSHEALDADT